MLGDQPILPRGSSLLAHYTREEALLGAATASCRERREDASEASTTTENSYPCEKYSILKINKHYILLLRWNFLNYYKIAYVIRTSTLGTHTHQKILCVESGRRPADGRYALQLKGCTYERRRLGLLLLLLPQERRAATQIGHLKDRRIQYTPTKEDQHELQRGRQEWGQMDCRGA